MSARPRNDTTLWVLAYFLAFAVGPFTFMFIVKWYRTDVERAADAMYDFVDSVMRGGA